MIANARVLVTGAAGFLGSHLCEKLVEYEVDRLVMVDDFSLGRMGNICKLLNLENVSLEKVDASDYGLLSEIYGKEDIDVTFNLAVIPLPASLIMPKKTIDVNVLITSTLCELQRKEKYETLIHTSSSEAYGTSIYTHKPMNEAHPTFPTTPYAASKLACDHIALSYYRTYGSDIAIPRPFNMYGPKQNEKSYAGVIPITIKRIMSGKSPMIHGDGLQTRDYSYVEDIADAIPSFYEVKSTRGKIINLASGEEVTIKSLIGLIMEFMDYLGDPLYTEPRRADIRRHRGDISLARKLIGYEPKTDFREGLIKTIEWYKRRGNDR